MVDIISQNTNNPSDSLFREKENDTNGILSSPRPQHKSIRTSPSLKIRGLRKHIPQRERYYTEDYALPNTCIGTSACDTLVHNVDLSVQQSPLSPFSSPRSTITAAANSTRFLRSRILDTIRNRTSSARHIIVDGHNDIDDTRSQSYENPSSLMEHESYKQDQRDQQLQQATNDSNIQSLKHCIDQLNLSPSVPTTPRTIDTTTTIATPICYQMTSDENPFKAGIVEQVLNDHVLPPLPLSSTINQLPNAEAETDTDVESIVSLSSSAISTISSDSARRYNSGPVSGATASMFPPLEIRCSTMKRKKRSDEARFENLPATQPGDNPSSIGVKNHTWYSSWVTSADSMPLSSNTRTDGMSSGDTKSRPLYIQTSPVTANRNNVSMFRLNAPKHKVMPIVSVQAKVLSPTYSKNVFKPIQESAGDENGNDDDRSSPPIRSQKTLAHGDAKSFVRISTGSPSVPLTQTTRSKTVSASVNDPGRNDIFRKRQSQTQQRPPDYQRRATTGSRTVPRRQFPRLSIGAGNLRRASAVTASTSVDDTCLDRTADDHNDPLLRNVPRRRASPSTKSVFSFGSIVGQSLSSLPTPTPPTSSVGSQSAPSASIKSFPTPTQLAAGADVNGDDGRIGNECSPKSIPRRKLAPFHNEMDYYWKQTKNRLLKVEKPSSINSLQRNPSGCLAWSSRAILNSNDEQNNLIV